MMLDRERRAEIAREIRYHSHGHGTGYIGRLPLYPQPGSRFIMNERSGNPGRSGFLLFKSNVSDEWMAKADGFTYVNLIPSSYFNVTMDEAFRP